MANYDAGHYFLTVMAPLQRDAFVMVDGVRRSVIDHVRHMLATLPTAQQDHFSAESGLMSPFARVPGTHFAHLFMIDTLHYNGRRPSNPIIDLLENVQLTIPEEVDALPHAYLVLAADFDAPDGSEVALRAYTDGLWVHMAAELRMLYRHCDGFGDVRDAATFFAFVKQGQVHTNLPFNDYWTYEPKMPSPTRWMAAASALMVVLAVMALHWGFWPGGGWSLFFTTSFALVAVNIAIVARFGLTPFPAAPDSDLPSILKALHVQQSFLQFGIDNLGKGGAELRRAFDAYCETNRPLDVDGPRQKPGVLWSDGGNK
jgi:hypothetical protein